MPLPLLVAVSPLPSDAFVPYTAPLTTDNLDVLYGSGPVETFDAVGRAELLARELPRTWSGSYRPYQGGESLPVELRIASATPMGQMVDIRGSLSVGGVESPVQGNLNAKSDQLDLLVLGDKLGGGLEPGGQLLGLQGFPLVTWQPPRLTSVGGRLLLTPQAAPTPTPAPSRSKTSAPSIRGLW
ncbi:MAG: hypothetical protein WAM11_08335 [Cyanobium sp.]